MNKKYVVLIVFVIAIVGSIYYLESMKAGPGEVSNIGDGSGSDVGGDFPSQVRFKDGSPLAPELMGITGYLNSEDGIKISDFRGKVVLIDFWTYTCINCIRTLPYLTEWDEKYGDKGLVLIGVHTPEFEFEKEKDNVQAAVDKYGIKYRVVQDNDYATWTAFENRFWPRKYLIDSEGYIRYDHIGEGGYEETEMKIQELLAEIGEDVSGTELTEETAGESRPLTPELYAGYELALPRFQTVGNIEGFQLNKFYEFSLPEDNLKKDAIYLEGLWKSNPDNLEFGGDGGSIVLEFTAGEVNIVADSLADPVEIEVLVDGDYVSRGQGGEDVQFRDGVSFVEIDKPQLYNVFSGIYGNQRLELRVKKGFIFNSFTFGS